MNPNISGKQFYHGTVQEFSAGDVIRPAGAAKFHGEGSGEHSYATSEISDAAHYAELAHDWTVHRMGSGPFPVPRIYRVEPVEHHEVEADPNQNYSNDYRTTSGWRVMGEEDSEEHFGDPEDWRH